LQKYTRIAEKIILNFCKYGCIDLGCGILILIPNHLEIKNMKKWNDPTISLGEDVYYLLNRK